MNLKNYIRHMDGRNGRRGAIMHMNKILRTTVGGRFIAPTADLSALRGCSGIRSILLKLIIAPA